MDPLDTVPGAREHYRDLLSRGCAPRLAREIASITAGLSTGDRRAITPAEEEEMVAEFKEIYGIDLLSIWNDGR